MDAINILNPFNDNYHALKDFKQLNVSQKIKTIALTALASIASAFIGTAAVFRLLVSYYTKTIQPTPEPIPTPPNPTIVPPIDTPEPNPEIEPEPPIPPEPITKPVPFRQISEFIEQQITRINLYHPINRTIIAPNVGAGAPCLFHPSKLLHTYKLPPVAPKLPLDIVKTNKLVSVHVLLEEYIRKGMCRSIDRFDIDRNLIVNANGQDIQVRVMGDCLKTQGEDAEFNYDAIEVDSMESLEEERKELDLLENECNLLAYFNQYIAHVGLPYAETLLDTDHVVFSEGVIRKSENEEETNQGSQVFSLLLKETYGAELGAIIFMKYNIAPVGPITFNDVKKALVGIAANVQCTDLKNLFDYIKQSDDGNLSAYRIGNHLYNSNKDLYKQIQAKDSFDLLTPAEVNFLYSAFKYAFDLTVSHTGIPKKGDFLYRQDLEAIRLKGTWEHLILDHPHLGIGEFTGKTLAYLELQNDQLVSLPPVNNELPNIPHLYKVENSLANINDDAVLSHLLVPLNKQQAPFLHADDTNEHIFLVFRGTKPPSEHRASGMSVYRDFDYTGIGKSAYDKREPEIQQMVENYLIKTTEEKVTLHLSGHSLGGCDTQRCLLSMLKKIAAAEEGSPWKKLNNVIVTTFNAPKVDAACNSDLKNVARAIKEKDLNIHVDLNHILYFDQGYEDVVQTFGDVLIGADQQGGSGDEIFKECPFFTRQMIEMRMQIDAGFAALGERHGYRAFNKALCKVPFEMNMFSTQNEEHRLQMEKRMAGSYHWDEKEMNIATKLWNYIIWYTTLLALRQPKKALQACIAEVYHAAVHLHRTYNDQSNIDHNSRRNPATIHDGWLLIEAH